MKLNENKKTNISRLKVNQENISEQSLKINKELSKKMTGYASIDKPWSQFFPAETSLEPNIDRISAYDYVYLNNKDYPNDIAFEYYNNKITYKDFFENVEKTYHALKQNGLREGSTIGVMSLSTPETIYLLYAASKLGVRVNMIAKVLSKETIEKIISNVDHDMFFILDILKKDLIDTIPEGKRIIDLETHSSMGLIPKMVIKRKTKKLNNETHESFKSFLDVKPKEYDVTIFRVAKTYNEENDKLIITYSSGSTGEQKLQNQVVMLIMLMLNNIEFLA